VCRALPIAGPCHSSGRSAPRPETKSQLAFPLAYRRDERSVFVRSFFESLDRLGILPGMTWPCAHMRETEFVQQCSDIALMIIDSETLVEDALEIDAPPAHHTIYRKLRTRFDDGREFRLLLAFVRRQSF
jgi:hypothetical protein